MTFFRALSVAIVGLGVLSSGCSGADGDDESFGAPDIDDPLYSSMAGPGGAGSVNSLSPTDFHPNRSELFAATKLALASWGGWWWNFSNANAGSTSLRSDVSGRNVLKYAVKCGLLGTVYDGGTGYTGANLLLSTKNWKTTGLATNEAEDLYACMIAHLNAYAVQVNINVSGPNVVNDPGFDPTEYTWHEALWVADLVVNGSERVMEFHAWPLDDFLKDSCSQVDKLKYRVCGAYSDSACGITVRDDVASACTESGDGWRCEVNGNVMPAVLTKLRVVDAPHLYWPQGKVPCP